MFTMRYAEEKDLSYCKILDSHISDAEFAWKLRERRYYVILDDALPVGVMRYHLFGTACRF